MVDTVPYEPHVGETRQYWRDIILGVNDGLVSIFLLVAGVVGGGLAAADVRLTAIAGAVAGAVSMAAGEYLATQSQEEVFDREIALERVHIEHHRQQEVDQLYEMFSDIGIADEDLDAVVVAFTKNDETILNTMKALEFGIIEAERRSPYRAMVASGLLFLVGSIPAIAPFFFTDSTGVGLAWAAMLTGLSLFAVGAWKTRVTKTNPLASGLQNMLISAVGGLVAFGVGSWVDSSL